MVVFQFFLLFPVIAVAVEDGMENGDSTGVRNGDTVSNTVNDNRFHQLKCRELFLSRQVETLSATHIRGKCSVTLLSEAETPVVYLDKEVCFVISFPTMFECM